MAESLIWLGRVLYETQGLRSLLWHVGSKFPEKGSNLIPLRWERRIFWSPRKTSGLEFSCVSLPSFDAWFYSVSWAVFHLCLGLEPFVWDGCYPLLEKDCNNRPEHWA